MRFTEQQYAQGAEALRDASGQLSPDAECCRICHDSGHQAWECGHNPLLAMAMCQEISQIAAKLHEELHAIEEAMNDEDQSEALAGWREDAHLFLHYLAGYDVEFGNRLGPARISMPEASP